MSAAINPTSAPAPRNAWQAFSQAKRRWVESNPSATPEQYEAAMQALAQRFGV